MAPVPTSAPICGRAGGVVERRLFFGATFDHLYRWNGRDRRLLPRGHIVVSFLRGQVDSGWEAAMVVANRGVRELGGHIENALFHGSGTLQRLHADSESGARSEERRVGKEW